MTDKRTVLLLGATGLFGGLLARRIVNEGRFELIASGRGEAALEALCAELGVSYRVMDREDEMAVQAILEEISPFAVVDCAGPFQDYGDDPYRFARAVIAAGAHYVDIADATDFVIGINALDEMAKRHGVCVISGASSTPAIAAAAADELCADFAHVYSIDTTIIPGNRARRTYSVMKAVLGQIGQPFTLRRHGVDETVRGWAETKTVDLFVPDMPDVKGRLASFVNTPDVSIFPQRYKADTVTFRAGLEIKLFHRALEFGRMLVASRILKSLGPFSKAARWLASWFEHIGSDAGGMQVKVVGERKDGKRLLRTWDLIASDGEGPEIPTMPISIGLRKLENGVLKPGASASPGSVTLAEVEEEVAKIAGKTAIHEAEVMSVFERALKESFQALPEPVRKFHRETGRVVYEGRAQSKGPTGILGWLASSIVGFPGQSRELPVRVTLTADEDREVWQREFDGQVFVSEMRVDDAGYVWERFGPLSMRLGLRGEGNKLLYPVIQGRLFGFIPVPRFLLPQSIAHETVDEEGRFVFDVLLKTPFGGRIAHYQGWLVKRDP